MMEQRFSGKLIGAAMVFLLCIVGYGLSISPGVTFWNAGELLAASKVLGIPHLPGTPLFVFLSNTWARFFPFGEYTFRVGVMTATLGALTAALSYLVLYETMTYNKDASQDGRGWTAHGAAFSGAIVSAFSFTKWQNSNEAEVYMLAMAIVTIAALLALHWRRNRGTVAGAKCLRDSRTRGTLVA